jgi:hypothetical protein
VAVWVELRGPECGPVVRMEGEGRLFVQIHHPAGMRPARSPPGIPLEHSIG